jgi:mannose-6-phosphate isomerase-like protein (cupin superfamily)
MQKPYTVEHWDSPKIPDKAFWQHQLVREGLSFQWEELPANTTTPEMKAPQTVTKVVISGQCQIAFPGFGTVDLKPGDRVDIEPDTLFDMRSSLAETTLLIDARR